MPVNGAPWLDKWWGGRLADGTVVVTNPDVDTRGLLDLTATPETKGEILQEPGEGVRGWLDERQDGERVPLPLPGEKETAYVPPTRAAGLIRIVVPILAVVAAFATRSPAWAFVIWLGAGVMIGSALASMYEHSKVAGLALVPVEPGDDSPMAPLRYVPSSVVETRAWARLAQAADTVPRPSGAAERVHRLLWSAAAIAEDDEAVSLTGLGRLDRLAEKAEQAILHARPRAFTATLIRITAFPGGHHRRQDEALYPSAQVRQQG